MTTEKTYTLTITAPEVNVIAAGLGKLPLETALAMFLKIREQVATQENPSQESGEAS